MLCRSRLSRLFRHSTQLPSSAYPAFLRHHRHSRHVAKETKLKCLTFSRIYGFVAFGALLSETSNPLSGPGPKRRRSISRNCGALSLLRQFFITIDVYTRALFCTEGECVRAQNMEPEDYF